MTSVLKIGGNQLDDPNFIARAAEIVARMEQSPVIVHGGGKGIKNLQEKLGITPQYIDGLRVTDAPTLELVKMVLCGAANIDIVAALTQAGVEAQGLNGADRGLLRGIKMEHPGGDLGRVGQITGVRGEIIRDLLAAKVVPVIAPVILAEDGGFYNVNADRAAGAVAAGIGAEQVIFLTDVPGVMQDGNLLEHITKAHAESLIAEGVARSGMAVKITAALDALSAGVGKVMITNLQEYIINRGTIISIGE